MTWGLNCHQFSLWDKIISLQKKGATGRMWRMPWCKRYSSSLSAVCAPCCHGCEPVKNCTQEVNRLHNGFRDRVSEGSLSWEAETQSGWGGDRDLGFQVCNNDIDCQIKGPVKTNRSNVERRKRLPINVFFLNQLWRGRERQKEIQRGREKFWWADWTDEWSK